MAASRANRRLTLRYAVRRGRTRYRCRSSLALVLSIGCVALYLVLRMTGVFYPYYSQGNWQIESRSIIAVAFLPPLLLETHVQNWLRWLPEPDGG